MPYGSYLSQPQLVNRLFLDSSKFQIQCPFEIVSVKTSKFDWTPHDIKISRFLE